MKIFRPKNLIIVAITQYLLQYFVLIPNLTSVGLSPSLSHWQFFWLVIDTLLIAVGGYIINDVIDLEADKINKPEKMTVERKWSKKKSIGIYVLLNLIGLEIAWILAGQVSNRWLMLIYPTAVLMLYLYSKIFKGKPLIGNIIVAIFCAGVAGIVLFAERSSFIELSQNYSTETERISWIFSGYILFAFLTTLFREIIKDIEDMEGDKMANLQTLPIAHGIPVAKKIAQATNFILIACTFIFCVWLINYEKWVELALLSIAVILPSVFQSIKLSSAAKKADFSKISKNEKWIMLAGIILLVLL